MEKLKLALICLVVWLLALPCGQACAQFALVQDKDGYVNVRSSADGKKAPVGRIQSGEVVFCGDAEGEWSYVFYGPVAAGYVHSSRLVPLTSFYNIQRLRLSKESVTFQKDSLVIHISSEPFFASKHKVEYGQLPGENRFLKAINGKSIWGTDLYCRFQW